MSLCVASAAAQEVREVSLSNPYAKPKPKSESKVNVHASLARAVVEKVSKCYRAEQGKPLAQEERALLEEFRSDVTRDLEPALSALGCRLDKPVAASCSTALDALACERLAAPIVEAGWDRNLTPEAKAQVAEYARALAAREGTCSPQDPEQVSSVLGLRTDRLAVLVEAEIVIGKCELVPGKLAECEAQLARAECEDMARLSEQGQLTHLCSSLLRCTSIAAPP
jgi:hypothetical protein